jgi:hypothetical protein
MNLPFMIDVAISLILIFLVGSLLASEIQELISTVLQWRAKHLKESIESLLSGGLSTTNEDAVKDLVDKIYDDPLIKGINQEARGVARYVRKFGRWLLQCIDFRKIFGGNKTTGPSYMMADTFTMALIEQLGLTLLARQLVEVRLTNFSKRIIGLVKVKEEFFPNGGYSRSAPILPDDDEELNRLWNKGRVRLMGEKTGFTNLNEDSNFKTLVGEFVDIVIDFKSGENDLLTSVIRMEESFTDYIASVEGSIPDASAEPRDTTAPQPDYEAFAKQLKNLKKTVFGNQGDRALASDLLRPSLVELAQLLDKTSQTYQEVQESFEELVKDGQKVDPEVSQKILEILLATGDTALLEQQLILKNSPEIIANLEELHPQPSQRYLPNLLTRQRTIEELREKLRQQFPDTSQFCCRIKIPAAARSQKAKAIAAELRKATRQNRKDIQTILRKLSEVERKALIQQVVNSLSDDQLYSNLSRSQSADPHLGLVDCVLDHMPNDERHLLIYNAISQLSRDQEWAPEFKAKQRSLYANYDTYKRVYIVLDQLPGTVKDSFVTLAQRAQSKVDKVEGNVEQFRKEMSAWFDQSMERSSGVYKRNAKLVSMLLGVAIAVAFNIDALYATSRFSSDENLRRVVTEAAIGLARDKTPDTSEETSPQGNSAPTTEQNFTELTDIRHKTNEALQDLVLPIGWSPQILAEQMGCSNNQMNSWDDFYITCGGLKETVKTENWLVRNVHLGWNALLYHKTRSVRMVIGWLSAGLAISMGAPFWFEILNKVVNVRNTGSKPASSATTSSEPTGKTQT